MPKASTALIFCSNTCITTARLRGTYLPYNANTPYLNTIPADRQPHYPGDREIERRISSIIRWNALAMVVRANKHSSELGGHIASFQSAATLYDIGFGHFWRAPLGEPRRRHHLHPGPFVPGHLRARLRRRASDRDQLLNFRREVDGKGLSSYPHPWLMPDFWQFPTVSMGLGPIMAIYQARFMKYLEGRGLAEMGDRKVWAFMGDGEMDEPESLGAISLAAREKLDNLIFVVNCNLQRLDGPVRGNGKIIQELEADFRGAGWNVIKVIWGSNWDALLARDKLGLLRKRMEECVDGEYQAFKSRDGAYVRKEFFAKYPELLEMVSGMTDDEVWQLRRGGHDPIKVYSGLRRRRPPSRRAHRHPRQDHQGLRDGRRRRGHEHHPSAEEDGPRRAQGLSRSLQDSECQTIRSPRCRCIGRPKTASKLSICASAAALRGSLPQRRRTSESLEVPPLSAFDSQLKSTDDREVSTTMAFVRILSALLRDKNLGNAHRADRPRRIAYLRNGRDVPPVRNLLAGRPAL